MGSLLFKDVEYLGNQSGISQHLFIGLHRDFFSFSGDCQQSLIAIVFIYGHEFPILSKSVTDSQRELMACRERYSRQDIAGGLSYA